MKKSTSTLANGGRSGENRFSIFLKNHQNLSKTGKKSVIASEKLVCRYPDSINLKPKGPKGATNSLSYCGSFKDKYICRYGCACMVMSRQPVQAGYSTGMRDKIEERDKIEAQEGLQ